MKISDVNSLNSLIRSGTNTDRPVVAHSGNSFREALSSINRGNCMQKLTEMSENIAKQGEVVGRRYDILELKRFKEMIAEYLYEAVRYMYEFKKQNTMDARGRHRMYAIIKKINQKLEEMTKQVLEKEGDKLELMAAIGDIRGMLLDILM